MDNKKSKIKIYFFHNKYLVSKRILCSHYSMYMPKNKAGIFILLFLYYFIHALITFSIMSKCDSSYGYKPL